MGYQENQLGQITPTGTVAVSIYTPSAAGITYIAVFLVAANNTTADQSYETFHDVDGSTYSASTRIGSPITLKSKQTLDRHMFVAGADENGNIAVASSSGNAITYSLYGVETW